MALALLAATSCAPASLPPANEPLNDYADAESYLITARACFPSGLWIFPPRIEAPEVRQLLFGDGGDFHVVYFTVDSVRACVLEARGDCDAARRCIGVDALPASATAAECMATTAHCEGTTAVRCLEAASPVILRQDCDALGFTCLSGQCVVACTGAGSTCADDRTSVNCVGGAAVVRRCYAGEACVEGECAPTGAACADTSCADDTLVECQAGREGARWDCTSGGLACAADPMAGAACVPAAHECDSGPASCDGASLVSCGPDGRVHRYDCVAHGFVRCDVVGDAICVPSAP